MKYGIIPLAELALEEFEVLKGNTKSIQLFMDKYSGKSDTSGSLAPRKGYKTGFKDATTDKDQNAQFCNRIGCHGRIKYSNRNSKIGNVDKAKCTKPHIDSKRKVLILSEPDPSGSSQSGNSEAPKLMSSPSRRPASHHLGSTNMPREEKIEISSMPSNVRPRKMLQQKPGSNKQKTQSASSTPSVSRSSGLGTLNGSNKSRCLKNLKCNSISDVIRSGCSSSGSTSVGENMMKKSTEREDSLSHRGPLTSAVSISGSRCSNHMSGEDTGRPNCANQSRTRLPYQTNGRNNSHGRETAVRISGLPFCELPDSFDRSSLSQLFSSYGSSNSSSSYSLSSSNDDNQSPFTPAELGSSHLAYRMDGIAEVLLALVRIDPVEMTHEQILALESSVFLNSLILYDQHRDMRLDIDNMSYEELLALGERMGTVSTALSEEALVKCVTRSIYQVISSEERSTGSGYDGDDVKCSICQEEYKVGDETGNLVECQHAYHIACINQWLRLKNWCPICKSTAATPESQSSS